MNVYYVIPSPFEKSFYRNFRYIGVDRTNIIWNYYTEKISATENESFVRSGCRKIMQAKGCCNWRILFSTNYDSSQGKYWVFVGVTLCCINYAIIDYIDVGDGCFRRNVLVTTIRCCWRLWPFWSLTFKGYHQNRNSGWVTHKLSTNCHQHHCQH